MIHIIVRLNNVRSKFDLVLRFSLSLLTLFRILSTYLFTLLHPRHSIVERISKENKRRTLRATSAQNFMQIGSEKWKRNSCFLVKYDQNNSNGLKFANTVQRSRKVAWNFGYILFVISTLCCYHSVHTDNRVLNSVSCLNNYHTTKSFSVETIWSETDTSVLTADVNTQSTDRVCRCILSCTVHHSIYIWQICGCS